MYVIDVRVWKCATQLENINLLAKLAAGEVVALEAKYRTKCHSNLYRARAATESTGADTDVDAHFNVIAFAELVIFEDTC